MTQLLIAGFASPLEFLYGQYPYEQHLEEKMKRLKQGMVVLAALLLINVGWAEQKKAELSPLRLVLDLVDGSHIIGVPSIKSIPVQTSYAKMDIPLKKIQSIEIEEAGERVYIALKNGDSFSGVLGLGKFEMTALFGKVTIGIEHVKRIQVCQVSSLPAGFKKGLVLQYSFDRDEGGKITDKSATENDGKLHGAKWTTKGKIGGGGDFAGTDDWVRAGSPVIPPGPKTVALWVMHRGGGKGNEHHLIGSAAASEHNGMRLMLTDKFQPKLAIWRGSRRHYISAVWGKSSLAKNRWYHLAIAWDGTIDKNAVRIYLDGELNGAGTASQAETKPGSLNLWLGIDQHDEGNERDHDGLMDEVMIWNRALSESEIKQLYDSQR